MYEVFVEGNKVDVNQEFSVMLTYVIDDIKDFAAKNTTVSKTIVFPGTKNNNKLFGNIFEISGSNDYDPTLPNAFTNFNASVSARFVIFNGNIQCMKGIMQMLQIVIDGDDIEYEIGFFGELSGFVVQLANYKLTGNLNVDGTPNTDKDLDFSTYDNYYDITNIVASWSNANGGSGLYYPLIDYGNYSIDKHNWKYGTFRPSLFLKEYIDKIFENIGYKYQCDLFNTTRFKSIIIPHNQKKLVNKQSKELDIVKPSSVTYNSTGISAENIAFYGTPFLGGFVASAGDTIFTFSSGEPFSGVANILFIVTATDAYGPPFDLKLYVNSVQVGLFSLTVGTHNITIPISINLGDVFEAKVTFSGGTSHYVTLNTTELQLIATDSTHPISINYGELLHINSSIPANILQVDFISTICKLFNLYVYEDPNLDKVLLITPFIDFYKLATSIDWSYKLDRSHPRIIKPMSELNARYYLFNFKDDTDFYNDLYKKRYNQSYGSYMFDSSYQFSIESQTIDLIISGTPLVGYTGEDKVYSTIFKRTGTDKIVEENTDSNIRLLQAKKVTGVTPWSILGDDVAGEGTISGSSASTTITGSGTNFTTQLTVGCSIYVTGLFIGIISSITDMYTAVLTAVPAYNFTSEPYIINECLHTDTVYPYAGHFDDPDAPTNDLNFGVTYELFFTLLSGAINVNQFNVYWSSYMAEITDKDSKMLTAKFKLTLKDIANLDFSKYVYVDGSLFRINKITDFNATKEDTCEVELIKLINSIY